ncbi:hypothetical protein GM418_00440 [Maribellus comscasis]|uniref:site-specific DNA-methyltransferase (adenine-specific) n=1 Tax=Maribellus comscasis TaxID=2681766 RepID=A0A6I6JWN7_9BACT|nr:TaqI-like C-terminal specificity domain-containing protein [Maribellus comscasis]QGY42174.1 hypothetical protein GM418_00440 [Maribellus comscasis]
MKLNIFHEVQFLPALKTFFRELNVPINYIADEPTTAQEILRDTYKDNDTFNLINDVYFVGMVDDSSFRGEDSIDSESIKSDYDGILIFGITLHKRANNLLPSRSQLAEITRAFNREFYYTPVALVFKYKNEEKKYIAFSNAERLKYKQAWREGEKAGKVSLLRDIDIENPHRGHEDIIHQLKIQTTGLKAVDSFDKLYKYWQEVFNVSILNKKFYQELQSWYFWAIKEVTFPNAPNRFDFDSDAKFDDAVKEHKGKNVIRLLTRLLFIWFIKEKKLVPEEIFDENYVANNLIKDFTPQKPHGVFATGKNTSMYYRAILQNLFFATLNQEMGKRQFRIPKRHMNVSNLMRYQNYFKDDGDKVFLDLMNAVPFMNGGLFECLDKPHPEIKGKQGGDIIIYEDGFSDRDDNVVEVPDFLFFDVDEEVDISDDIGSTNRIYKEAKTRGLLEILKSYKFTITENTPIEEDVALDPELLGKVFENLLASYNPETKTTARKQTGSFYTPREIVNYMVDESLIAYLKNTIKNWDGVDNKQLDEDLHTLVAFDNPRNPFEDKNELQNQIIKALDNCKILDPACGSGAFPMGILQKMVYILHKVDPSNTEWKHRQILRVDTAIQSLEEIEDAEFREKSIRELNQQKTDIDEAFKNNELDYGRKLYLIENCIYGVDIQSIATQISKLRFFISLVVDQKIDKTKKNFGVLPLPNLETKFVTANTLIGIEKPDQQGNLFDNEEVKKLEDKLKKIRHKLFSSKSPARKRELREEDKLLREEIAELLKNSGWHNETARQLASWDPYDQNASSPFFDPEWMFDISFGFDIIIGNPPYKEFTLPLFLKKEYKTFNVKELYSFFIEKCVSSLLKPEGCLSFITGSLYIKGIKFEPLREFLLSNVLAKVIWNVGDSVFEKVQMPTTILICSKEKQSWSFSDFFPDINMIEKLEENTMHLSDLVDIQRGFEIGRDKVSDVFSDYPIITGSDVEKWEVKRIRYMAHETFVNFNNKDIRYFTLPRVLIRETGSNLLCLYLEKKLFSNRSLYSLILKPSKPKKLIKCILLILNSDLIQYYYSIKYKSDTDIFPKIRIAQAKKLPIKNDVLKKLNLFSFLADVIIYFKKAKENNFTAVFNKIANVCIMNIYFLNYFNEHNFDILSYIENDILSLVGSFDFNHLNEMQKRDITQKLCEKWNNSNNEITKRTISLRTKVPDFLKPILES